MKPKLIIFDLDGTLYDLKDVHEANYAMQVRFLQQQLKITKSDAISMLEANSVYPIITDQSKSATELFARLGLDMNEWIHYREANFDVTKIDKSRAVPNLTIQQFAELCPLVLLSSNTYENIVKILDYIEIDRKLFKDIYCSNHASMVEPFTKKKVMQIIAHDFKIDYHDILSIGDRYQTDVAPLEALGGIGIAIKEKEELEQIINQLL